MVGFYNLGQLSNFTGKFNYGDTHHARVLHEDRPSAYRTCYSNHYYSLTTIFTLYLRSGDPDLLEVFRDEPHVMALQPGEILFKEGDSGTSMFVAPAATERLAVRSS